MKSKFKCKLLVFIPFLLLFSLAASTPGVGLLLESANSTDFPKVQVRLSAWDAEGLPLQNLAETDFNIRENGGAAFPPDSVRVDKDAPLSVVLVLDVSGSMLGQPITDAKVAAARFLDRLSAGDQAALIAFSDQVNPDPMQLNPQRELGFRSNFATIYDLIEGLQAQGATHLYNAIAKSVAMTQSLPSGHRAVLVLSDGVNEPADVGSPDDPINMAIDANLPIFVIGLGNRIDEPYLRRLTSETGGVLRLAPSSSELAQTFEDMAALLKTQYTLVYTSQITNGARSVDLEITLKTLGSEVSAHTTLPDLPALPTDTPQPTPTFTAPPPTATAVPPLPTALPTPIPTPQSPAGWMGFIQDLPFYAWLILVGCLAAGLFLLIKRVNRKPTLVQKCARCGFELPEGVDVCPQCGEVRHYPSPEKKN